MRSLLDISKALNRPVIYISGLQKRFELPPIEEVSNREAYFEFLRVVVAFRTFNISEESLRELWHLEKKLLQLLHLDSTGSATWFLDACSQPENRHRRLLLTNYDLGVRISASNLQLGLNFATRPAELFAGQEMGEDAMRVLRECVKLQMDIYCAVSAELPHIRAAVNWGAPLARCATNL